MFFRHALHSMQCLSLKTCARAPEHRGSAVSAKPQSSNSLRRSVQIQASRARTMSIDGIHGCLLDDRAIFVFQLHQFLDLMAISGLVNYVLDGTFSLAGYLSYFD